ncbi:ashwin-like [Liolophura sinensis]|uniref:ashwin-like n=1 Tax=Liolophura sinensis TaxID=3198878 RepID=UPI003158E1C8
MGDNNNEETREQKIDWQFPELLSNEGLIEFLKRRYVELPQPCTLDREKLLELYYRHVIPLPQRQYKPNRRGREMTKKQILLAKKRKITFSNDAEPIVKKRSLSNTSEDKPLPRFMTSANVTSSSSERTEPPKSMINFDRKVIRLNSGKVRSSSIESGKQRITVSNTESENKTVTVKSVESCRDVKNESSSRTIKLGEVCSTVDKSTSEGREESQGSADAKVQKHKMEEESGNSPKKKFKRISWP